MINYNYDIKHAHIGFYVYDGKAFLTRESALDAMLLKKDYNATMQFYYNDHVYGNMNWEREIVTPISVLYKERAQQLRDKYKYLALRFSGGSDSTQVLETFLKNDIFLDEVIIAMQEKAISGIDESVLFKDANLQQFLEYKYAAIPLLKKVKELSPNTKITAFDTTDGLYDQIVNKKYNYLGHNDEPLNIRFVTPQLSKSYTYMIQQHQKCSSNDGVAVIRGLEKPVIDISEDGKIFNSFFDITMSGSIDLQVSDSPYTLEDFYWSPDFPLIPIKQCQMIIHALSNDKLLYEKYKTLKNYIVMARDNPSLKNSPSYVLERLYNKIIYPDWNLSTFVAPKAITVNPDFSLLEKLNFKSEVTRAKKFMEEFTNHKLNKYEKIINKKQLNRLMFSRLYYLGQFKPNF